jgi:phage terminase large subunit-like protein
VVDGGILANIRIRAACRRYLELRAKPAAADLWWDEAGAEAARQFAYKAGQGASYTAGKPLVLMPWQCLVAMLIHGARRVEDGRRTDFPFFRAILVVVAKGNGKSDLMASTLLSVMRDPNQRVKCSSGAPDARLSQIVHERMQVMCPNLNANHPDGVEWKVKGATTTAIPGKVNHGLANFETLPCTDKAFDGRIDRLCILDEVARMQHGVGRAMTGLAKSPLSQLVAITTPDTHMRLNPVFPYWDAVEKALVKGEQPPTGWFGLFYGLDDEDRAEDPETWIKANPSLGVTVRRSEIETAAKIQLESGDPKQIAEFETQIACRYVELADSDLDIGTLKRQMEPCDWSRLAGAQAVIAIDFSRGGYGPQLDLTTLCLMVVDGAVVRARNVSWWAGLDVVRDERKCKQPLGQWIERGYLRRMPGEWHDCNVIAAEVEALMARYQVMCIATDQHVSQNSELRKWQDRGWPVVPFHQGIQTTGPAWKMWCDWLRSRQLFYDEDPVLVAALQGLKPYKDINGNVKPHKALSTSNTDAVIAGMMAVMTMDQRNIRVVTGLAASACPIG